MPLKSLRRSPAAGFNIIIPLQALSAGNEVALDIQKTC